MIQIKFNNKQELLEFMFQEECQLEEDPYGRYIPRDILATAIGIEYINKMDITGNEDDDGIYAGPNYYTCREHDMPVYYPVVLALSVTIMNHDWVIDWNWIYNDSKEKSWTDNDLLNFHELCRDNTHLTHQELLKKFKNNKNI